MASDGQRGDSVLRLGVIGCGRIAQVAHLPAIAKEASVQLVAVSDPSLVLATAVGARYGVPGYTDTADLLREDLDAVLIAVPDYYQHEPWVPLQHAGKGGDEPLLSFLLRQPPYVHEQGCVGRNPQLHSDRGS